MAAAWVFLGVWLSTHLAVQLREQESCRCRQHLQHAPQLRAPPTQVQHLVADIGQVEVPEVAAEVAGVVELAQGCALLHVLLLETSDFTLQDGFGVDPAIGVLAVCPGKQACNTHECGQQ